MELVTVSVQSQIAELDQRMHDDESNPIDLVVRRKNLISTLERAETLFDATMKAAEADHKRIEELIHKQQTRMKQEQQQQELWLRCERKIMVFTEHALRLREAAVERKNSKQVHRLEAVLSRRKFKESLVQHYGAACPTDPSLLRCLVTSEYVHQDRCVAVQLLPQQLLPVYTCGGIDSADDVRNGFLWIDRIDQAYAANQVCLLYDSLSAKLLFLVLNAALLDVDLGVSNLKFRDVHFKKLDVDRSLIPNLQAIYSQAIFATYLMENGVSQPSALLKSVQFSSKRQTSLDDVDRQQNDKAVVSESSNNMSTNS